MKFDDINFGELYKNEQIARRKWSQEHTQEMWNKRAPSFLHPGRSDYTQNFLDRIKLTPNDEILDFGCGPGTIALEIAPLVKSVLGCDLSNAMLDELNKNAKNLGIKNIQTKNLAFEDSWDNLPKFDVVIASRSLEVMDLQSILEKIISKAKRSVYLTYKVGKYFYNKEISDIIGVLPSPDYIYVLNILYQMNIKAKLDFITHSGKSFETKSVDEFLEKMRWFCGNLDEIQTQKLTKAYENLENKKSMQWAFISFDV